MNQVYLPLRLKRTFLEAAQHIGLPARRADGSRRTIVRRALGLWEVLVRPSSEDQWSFPERLARSTVKAHSGNRDESFRS